MRTGIVSVTIKTIERPHRIEYKLQYTSCLYNLGAPEYFAAQIQKAEKRAKEDIIEKLWVKKFVESYGERKEYVTGVKHLFLLVISGTNSFQNIRGNWVIISAWKMLVYSKHFHYVCRSPYVMQWLRTCSEEVHKLSLMQTAL